MENSEIISSAESPRSRIDNLLNRADEILGIQDLPDNFDAAEWNDAEARLRIEEIMRKAHLPKKKRVGDERLKLSDIFSVNIDQSRLQTMEILESKGVDVTGSVPLTSLDRRLIVGSQMEVSQLEIGFNALRRYLDLIRMYREGMSVYRLQFSEENQKAVANQFESVIQLSEHRISLSYDYTDALGNQSKRESIKKEILNIDKELISILASGNNLNKRNLPLPYIATIDAIEERYERIYADIRSLQKQDITEKMSSIRESVEKFEKMILEKYNASNNNSATSIEDVPEDAANEILGDKEFQTFQINRVLLSVATASTVDQIRALQEKNAEVLSLLSDINRSVGMYELHRSRLASIRHHFDQAYELTGGATRRFMDLPLSDEQVESAAEFLKQEQYSSISQISDHVDFVDEKVLRVGTMEELEKKWNEDGRLFVGILADFLVSFETSLLPGERLKGLGKDAIMEGIYDSLGWPRNTSGKPVDWNDLTDEDKERMRSKQKSTLKAIYKFRGFNEDGKEKISENPVASLQSTLNAAEKLIKNQDKYLRGENVLQFKKISKGDLIKDPITDVYLDELIREHGASVVAASVFYQLNEQWEEYSNRYGTFLQEVHEVVGVHIEWGRMMKEFGNFQRNVAAIFALLAGMGLAVGGLAFTAATYSVLKIPRIASKAGKNIRAVGAIGKGLGIAALAGVAIAETGIALSITPSKDTKMTGQGINLLEDLLESKEGIPDRNWLNPFASKMIEIRKSDVDYFVDALKKRQEVLYMRDVVLVLEKTTKDTELKSRIEKILSLFKKYDSAFTERFPLEEGILGESAVVGETVSKDAFVQVYKDGLLHKAEIKKGDIFDEFKRVNRSKKKFDDSIAAAEINYDDLVPLREEFLDILRQAGVLTDIPEL